VFFATEEERRLARQSFWPFRCRERVVAFGTKDLAGSADAQIAAFRALLPQLAGREFLLFLSRIHPKKGCDLLIRAFATAAAENKELHLVMAGPDSVGWKSRMMRIAEDLGVANQIQWPGMLRGDQKWEAFRAAEAFVLPSHQENFGFVVAEAMHLEVGQYARISPYADYAIVSRESTLCAASHDIEDPHFQNHGPVYHDRSAGLGRG
jgi:glycosyltransferase involved in cell wall biosynthesis